MNMNSWHISISVFNCCSFCLFLSTAVVLCLSSAALYWIISPSWQKRSLVMTNISIFERLIWDKLNLMARQLKSLNGNEGFIWVRHRGQLKSDWRRHPAGGRNKPQGLDMDTIKAAYMKDWSYCSIVGYLAPHQQRLYTWWGPRCYLLRDSRCQWKPI